MCRSKVQRGEILFWSCVTITNVFEMIKFNKDRHRYEMKRLNKSVQFRHTRSKCTFNKEHTVRTHTHTHTHTQGAGGPQSQKWLQNPLRVNTDLTLNLLPHCMKTRPIFCVIIHINLVLNMLKHKESKYKSVPIEAGMSLQHDSPDIKQLHCWLHCTITAGQNWSSGCSTTETKLKHWKSDL